MELFFYILQTMLLITALTLDSFVASFGYGAGGIRIPPRSAIVLNLICSAMLLFSMMAGSLLRPFLSEDLASHASFAILFALGLLKLCDSSLKALIRRHKSLRRDFSISALHLRFLLTVYADPEEADSDHSQTLSVHEAGSLAIALSLDGLAVGFGAAFTDHGLFLPVLLCFLMGMLAVWGGCGLGNRLSKYLRPDLSWLSGVLLIILALLRL